MKDSLIPVGGKASGPGGQRQADHLWLRISSFLDQKSPNTQRTYAGIIREWCSFLGAEAGSEQAAALMLKATDLHAMGYKKWLEEQPGQKPSEN